MDGSITVPESVTILHLLGAAIAILVLAWAILLTWFIIAACVQSGNDAEAERRADTLTALAARSAQCDETEHDDG